MAKKQSIIKKLLTRGIYLLVLVLLVLYIPEFFFRYQLTEFYSAELNGLNSKEVLKRNANKKTILVMGDSFSAHPNSYVAKLREKLTDYQIINAAIPGTGINEAKLIAKKRIKEFEPNIFIYQVYVGNDLLDISKPINWQELSLARNLYWSVTKRLYWIKYLNYKMGAISVHSDSTMHPNLIDTFNADAYNTRVKTYLKANPNYIEDCIQLNNKRENDIERLANGINDIIHNLPDDCKIYCLVIPHSAQVNQQYVNDLKDIDATFSQESKILKLNYPFLDYLQQYSFSKGVEFLNPLGNFQKYENDSTRTTVYYKNDPHLNDDGQNILANYIYDYLAR